MSWYCTVAFTSLLGISVVAADKPAERTGQLPPAAWMPGQKTCPVTGRPVSRDVVVEYEKQRIYFCCADCPARFRKDPLAYLANYYRQVYPQTVQVDCPVMGGPVNRKSYVDYEGRRIYFCCPDCEKDFQKAPAKYVAKMKEVSTDQVHCPVTGEAIFPKYRTEYKGRPVFFATKEAKDRFEASPEKYADRLRPELGVIARGPTAEMDLVMCPVCAAAGGGRHLRRDVSVLEVGAKRYFVCGDRCAQELKADPTKYDRFIPGGAAGPQPSPDSGGPSKTEQGHTGHSDSRHGH